MPDTQSRVRELRKHGPVIASNIHWLSETASTQDDCRRLTEETHESVVVIADRQTAGRGQYGRTWEAPSGRGLLMSVSLPGPPAEIPALSMWAAAAIACMLEIRFGLSPRVKWPNDVLVGGRKIAGVLVEVRGFAVVGVGLNVLQQPNDFPPDCRLPPTSIAMETNSTPDRVEVAAWLLEELERLGNPSDEEAQRRIFEAWRSRLDVQPGELVVATTNQSAIEGTFIEIDNRNGLQLRMDADVTHIPLARLLRLESRA